MDIHRRVGDGNHASRRMRTRAGVSGARSCHLVYPRSMTAPHFRSRTRFLFSCPLCTSVQELPFSYCLFTIPPCCGSCCVSVRCIDRTRERQRVQDGHLRLVPCHTSQNDADYKTGLLPLLKSIQKPCNLKKFAGQTIGVDAYGWLHRGTAACAIDLALDKPTTK